MLIPEKSHYSKGSATSCHTMDQKLNVPDNKNLKMKRQRISLRSNLKPWHLLAGIYGFIIVAGIIYRIINA